MRRWSGSRPRPSSRSTARSLSPRSRVLRRRSLDLATRRGSGYFHFFGLKGAFLSQLGRAEEARVAFDRAIALANTAAEAAHIRQHLDRLMKDGLADAAPTAG